MIIAEPKSGINWHSLALIIRSFLTNSAYEETLRPEGRLRLFHDKLHQFLLSCRNSGLRSKHEDGLMRHTQAILASMTDEKHTNTIENIEFTVGIEAILLLKLLEDKLD